VFIHELEKLSFLSFDSTKANSPGVSVFFAQGRQKVYPV